MISGIAKLLLKTTNPRLRSYYRKLLEFAQTNRGKYDLALDEQLRKRGAPTSEIMIPMAIGDEVIGFNSIPRKYLFDKKGNPILYPTKKNRGGIASLNIGK
jgi:hypothetical protein|tara:strand:+ start:476 stop:778 length:303 start_codon:yes stop_codon:yes gene_type:complete